MEMDFKTAKTELIAIYRLEFYKNKKNWKLCSDVRKLPPRPQSSESKSRFNETYDVQLEADSGPEPPLNQAFLNEVPVDEPYPEPYHEPLLGAPAQAPDLGQAWPSQQWMEPEEEDQEEWCGVDAEGVPEAIAYPDVCDGPYQQRLWPPAEQCSQPEYSPLRQLELSSPAELLALAEDWLQLHGYQEDQDQAVSFCDQYPAADAGDSDSDSTQFVRGAHLAPHSSEAELSLARDECPCVSVWSLRTASATRLAHALRPHAAALREILLELATREAMRPPSPYLRPEQFEERPTRDCDPEPAAGAGLPPVARLPGARPAGARPAPPPAGLLPGAGRGRGRGRLIGLDMGRPYRL